MPADIETRRNESQIRRAVYLYQALIRREREVDRAEQDLHRFLSSLSPDERNEYAKRTMDIDAKRNA